jgi:transmembrane protein 17
MTAFNQQLLKRKDEKLPLAILIHFNFYLSVVFALLIGRLVFYKHGHYHFCNSFQRSLLVPAYCTWLMAEIPRLYIGMKGVLRDKLPEVAAFFLLSFFPQVWIALYLSFLQEIILPVDTVLGMVMIIFIVAESALAWRFLRSIITRQSAPYNRGAG